MVEAVKVPVTVPNMADVRVMFTPPVSLDADADVVTAGELPDVTPEDRLTVLPTA